MSIMKNVPLPEDLDHADPAAPPLQLGQHVELEVTDLSFGGEGVARHAGFVVFVPLALPGEHLEAEIVSVKKQFARAALTRVLRPSPDRATPRCPYFGECGGCQYQHLTYPVQLRWKQDQLREILVRIGGFANPPIAPIRPSPQEYAYRNRIMVRSQWDKRKQGLNIGFLRHDNRLVVDVESCCIASPELNRQLTLARQNPPPRGGIKITIREMPIGWEVPPDSFFQNNPGLLPELVGAVRECFIASRSRFLVDAFCGVGFFALELADLSASFVGLELDAQAIRAARANMRNRSIRNGRFEAGATEDLLPDLLHQYPAAQTTVLVDPPRKGCLPQTLDSLLRIRPNQIIYVSCHPATLARDLKWLCAQNVFRLESVIPLDMFPQTQHIETVCDLRVKSHQA